MNKGDLEENKKMWLIPKNRILDIYFLNDRINSRQNANNETRLLVIIVMWTLDWSPSMKSDGAWRFQGRIWLLLYFKNVYNSGRHVSVSCLCMWQTGSLGLWFSDVLTHCQWHQWHTSGVAPGVIWDQTKVGAEINEGGKCHSIGTRYCMAFKSCVGFPLTLTK